MAENFMKLIGKVIKTAAAEGKDWKMAMYEFLANHRVTPHTTTGVCPQEMMMRRPVRQKLPTITELKLEKDEKMEEKETKEKWKQKM